MEGSEEKKLEQMTSLTKIECKICGNKDYTHDNFYRLHLKKVHNMEVKEYYDTYLKKLDETIACENCNQPTPFYNMNKGYRKYCSQNCARTSKLKRKQLSDSWEDRDLDEVARKYKETCLEKYGVEHYDHTEEFKNRYKETCLEKYGVEHNFLIPECIEKRKSVLENNKEEINKKRKKYWTEENIAAVNEKRRQTNLLKYGSSNVSSSDFFRKYKEINGEWIPNEFKSEFKNYKRIVFYETKKWRDSLLRDWDGKCYYTKQILIDNEKFKLLNPEMKASSNRLQPTVDHKISVFYGFVNQIEPIVIADVSNLCICARYINSSKSYLNEDEFLRILKNESI